MVDGIDGIKMINPPSIGGEEWYIATTPKEDPRFNSSSELTGNYDDGFVITAEPALIQVETSMGYNMGSVRSNVNHSFISSVGFMYQSNDWRDVEITGLFNCANVTNANARIQIFARCAEITERRQWCPGTFYMGELTMDGQFRWTKGQYHLSYESKPWLDSNTVGLGSDLTTRIEPWFGLKIVMNNEDIGLPGEGKQGVRLWAYVDKLNNNEWELIDGSSVLDNGGWGKDGGFCGGNDDQIITWGGPLASFAFPGGSSQILFKRLSVREIDVGGQFLPPAATTQTAYAAAKGFQRVIAMSTHRYRVGTFITPTCKGEVPTDPDPSTPPPEEPPESGNIQKMKRIAHKYNINSIRTSVTSIDEFPQG